MGNVLLRVVKIGLTGAAIYYGGQACKIWGYFKGYSDSSEVVFDALNMEDEDAKDTSLASLAKVGKSWKELKTSVKGLNLR